MHGYDDPEVALLLGTNPFKSYYGVACGNPGTWLGERLQAGMQLIVIDPRRSDVAKRATLHIQPVPGEDAAILACMINVILSEGLHDRSFVEENAHGLAELGRVVRPFSPEQVARRADVEANDLIFAARTFAAARRGYVACGVGPGFSSSSVLVFVQLSVFSSCRSSQIACSAKKAISAARTTRARAKPRRWGFSCMPRCNLRSASGPRAHAGVGATGSPPRPNPHRDG